MPEEQKTTGEQQPNKPWLVNVLAVIALGSMAVAGYLFFLAPKNAPEKSAPPPLHSFSLGNTVVNLGEPYSGSYLRVGISLAYREEATAEVLAERQDEIKDLIIDILRRKDVDDVADVAKTEALRRELMQAVNRVLAEEGRVEDVYFTEFIVQ